jgi:hypothetical protein
MTGPAALPISGPSAPLAVEREDEGKRIPRHMAQPSRQRFSRTLGIRVLAHERQPVATHRLDEIIELLVGALAADLPHRVSRRIKEFVERYHDRRGLVLMELPPRSWAIARSTS